MKNLIPKCIGFFINVIGIIAPKYAAKLAILLFSTPKKGKIKPKELEYLKDASQEEISFENITITTYHWKGEKDTILLAHGWESNTFRWKDLIEELRVLNYNIIALDAPGHGASSGKTFNAILYADCINVVVKKFNIQTIIGHSVGGMATVFFQHKYQLKSIEKLVLLGAPANFTGVLSRYADMMGYSKRVIKAIDQHILKHYNNLPEYFTPSVFIKEISAKGLIIHDEKDRIIPFNDGIKFKENYANANFIATTGFGHGLKSKPVYQNILDFLND
ncbi:alpha/beta hydrolase [Algibacter pectinivorans]|uniref:Alpha/beta hydrolase family protein n=1 Tax=Algibacter pectinivorans TaxID=870482 RepID=A0A1I1M850_9FLAO|nr:alpha/beta hydrolase [Algibacter pectinivorans]SFC81514.1 Alpha/beta hydrolase family protein [Algibacter pectinivorans]